VNKLHHEIINTISVVATFDYVSILSVSYSLEKNTGSGRGVTSFKNQAQICA